VSRIRAVANHGTMPTFPVVPEVQPMIIEDCPPRKAFSVGCHEQGQAEGVVGLGGGGGRVGSAAYSGRVMGNGEGGVRRQVVLPCRGLCVEGK